MLALTLHTNQSHQSHQSTTQHPSAFASQFKSIKSYDVDGSSPSGDVDEEEIGVWDPTCDRTNATTIADCPNVGVFTGNVSR